MLWADDYEKTKNEIAVDPTHTELEGQMRCAHSKWSLPEKRTK